MSLRLLAGRLAVRGAGLPAADRPATGIWRSLLASIADVARSTEFAHSGIQHRRSWPCHSVYEINRSADRAESEC